MSESWQRRILWLAATWNVLGGASALFNPRQHFAHLYSASLPIEDPLPLFFYRVTWINVLAWGALYALAAGLPASRRPVLVAGAAGKLMYCVACVALFASGVGKVQVLVAGGVDLLLAALFVAALVSNRRKEREPHP